MTGRQPAGGLGQLVAGLAAAVALVCTPTALAGTDSSGTDFWLAFPGNNGASTLTLTITGATATTGTVSAPGLSFSEGFTITPGASSTITVPDTAALQTVAVESRGIHVTAGADVTVTGLNRNVGSVDGFLAFPVDALGTDYRALEYPNNGGAVNGTQFGVVAPSDNTAVTITPSATTNGHAAGTPYVVNLNQGQTYLLRESTSSALDLSNTRIQSDKPVAVFGGHACANIPSGGSFCDHLVEQLPPLAAWGRHFVQVPLATRDQDVYRLLSSADGTTLTWKPAPPPGAPTATSAGSVNEYLTGSAVELTSTKPVLLMQFSQSSSADAVAQDDTDPFQSLVPPVEQWLSEYVVTTPALSFSNYLNLAVPTSSVGQVTIDGSAVPSGSFTAVADTNYSVAQVPVGIGPHAVAGPDAFGASLYGWATSNEAYGYVAGLGAAPIGSIGSLTLSPKATTAATDSTFCPVASVRDASQNPVAAIAVDFAVTGANATRGTSVTGSDGQAPLCFAHPNTGDSTIVAKVVNLVRDSATVTWTAPAGPGGPATGNPPPGGSRTPTGSGGVFSIRAPRSVRLASILCRVVKRVRCRGLVVGASLPSAGSTTLTVTAVKGRKSVALGKLTRTATRSGSLRLVFAVKQKSKAQKLYRAVQKGRFKRLRVVASFTPSGGRTTKVTKSVALKLP